MTRLGQMPFIPDRPAFFLPGQAEIPLSRLGRLSITRVTGILSYPGGPSRRSLHPGRTGPISLMPASPAVELRPISVAHVPAVPVPGMAHLGSA